MKEFDRLYEIIRTLRGEHGCPWDKEQTPLSLRSTFFEETCEAIDAITQEDAAHTKEELGDVLLNVVMIAYLFEQNGLFTVEECIDALCEKLVRRHPHVFSESEGRREATEAVSEPSQVLAQWDRIKENIEGRKCDSVLDSVPEQFPPILRAYKLMKKAAKTGFDWNSLSEVKMKFDEELAEFHEAADAVLAAASEYDAKPFTTKAERAQNDAQLHLEAEFGDVLLAFINYGRWLGVDPSVALTRANKKFYRRFSYIEKRMKELQLPMDESQRRTMLELWNEAKKAEK